MRDMIKPALVLFIICLTVGAAMGFTNAATSEKIVQRIAEDSQNAKKAVLKGADSFKKLDMDKIRQAAGTGTDYGALTEAYTGEKDGVTVGYVFFAKPSGYAGEISMAVGIDKNGAVSGVEIGDNNETPGLGSKAKDQKFKGQFNNKKYAVINVVKRKAEKDDEVQAISGATITSKAVSKGVLQASKLAGALLNNKLGVAADELVEDNR